MGAVIYSLADSKFGLGAAPRGTYHGLEMNAGHAPFVSLTGADIERLADSLERKPGAHGIVASNDLPFTVRAISEQSVRAEEFEIHEFRDHVVQVLAGETTFAVGGEAENPRTAGLGEQLALDVKGSSSVTMKKGDLLAIPCRTPHKRTTSGKVVMLMISVNH